MKIRSSTTGIINGPIAKGLLMFFFPIMFGTFFQQLYNTVDAIIVGRFLGKEALAAVGGGTGVLINLLVGFFVGLCSGCTILISQYYGAKNDQRVSDSTHTSIAISLIGGLAITIIGVLFSRWALTIMDTPADIFDLALTYMTVYFIGVIPTLIYNMVSSILRAAGDSRTPFYGLIIASVVNVVLDLLFVAVFHMGVAGAAFATVLSQLASMIYVWYKIAKIDDSYRVEFRKIKIHNEELRKMLRLGVPTGIQSVLYTISNIIIQKYINGFGTDVVAAWAAYSKLDVVFWMIINAFGLSVTTFAGQNYGAMQIKRMKKSTWVCMGLSMIAAFLLSTLFVAFGPYLLQLFIGDDVVVAVGYRIIMLLAPFFFAYVPIEIFSGVIRGAGRTFTSTVITCVGICVLRIVYLTIATRFSDTLETVLFSYIFSWSLTSIVFFIYYISGKWLKLEGDRG